MSSSQVNLSGFNAGENNINTGKRLNGEARKIILSVMASDKRDRDERLKKYIGVNNANSQR